ncbi:MAG: hypothetical protein V7754_18105 [Halioglobus sp.]
MQFTNMYIKLIEARRKVFTTDSAVGQQGGFTNQSGLTPHGGQDSNRPAQECIPQATTG